VTKDRVPKIYPWKAWNEEMKEKITRLSSLIYVKEMKNETGTEADDQQRFPKLLRVSISEERMKGDNYGKCGIVRKCISMRGDFEFNKPL